MTRCFSLTESRNWCYRSTFAKHGLRPVLTNLGNGFGSTVIHLYLPKSPEPSKPNLLLIHGLGANALWQFADALPHLSPCFNLYIPDLLFFGYSYTNLPDRSDSFQARCIARALKAHSVARFSLVGLSYGGFVGYRLAALFPEEVEKVVVCCAGVCMEQEDLKVFSVTDLEEAVRILVPETPDRLRELVGYTMHKGIPVRLIPSCLLKDFIDAMCAEFVEEKRDLVRDIPKNRKITDIPRITQPLLIIWGEHDQIFPVELAYRLKEHVGENSQLEIIKDTGHACNVQKPKEFYAILKSFLFSSQSAISPVNESNDCKGEKEKETEMTMQN
ncbi:hypothetical protein MLD38_034788 [Melastoma candidum]|uniref:Uncharacterized protein n=1 Tax=Melastoma candidum TaxID=119954 RepID=A0ACB9MAP5_9MYRT|nr:hypothetical protein MLD38_034788 [Melastoma candidum]